MYSPFYGYYYIKTADETIHFSTKDVEQFFSAETDIIPKADGLFEHKKGFLSLGLMLLDEFESYNTKMQYDPHKSNYVSVVTSEKKSPRNDMVMRDLQKLALFLNLPLVEEEAE